MEREIGHPRSATSDLPENRLARGKAGQADSMFAGHRIFRRSRLKVPAVESTRFNASSHAVAASLTLTA